MGFLTQYTGLSQPLLRRLGSMSVMVMHLAVLAGALALIAIVSIDTLADMSLTGTRGYMSFQLCLCILFLIDALVDWLRSSKRWQDNLMFIIFVLVSLPYVNIFDLSGSAPSVQTRYFLRIMPVIRGVYVLAVISGKFGTTRVGRVFVMYVALALLTVYFSSLMFYVEEKGLNPQVDTYWTALWWAGMNMTTTGCDIHGVTAAGKTLAVVLSACGLMLFPVFTVYISSALQAGKDATD